MASEEDQPDEVIALSDAERYIRDRLATVVIPNVDFDNEPFDEVLQFLHLKLREMESTQLSGLGFIVRKPSVTGRIIDGDDSTIEEGISQPQSPTITLRETDATFTQLINQICEQGGYRWNIEDNVIVYTPND